MASLKYTRETINEMILLGIEITEANYLSFTAFKDFQLAQ